MGQFEFDIGYISIYLLATIFGIFLIFIFYMMCKDYHSIGRPTSTSPAPISDSSWSTDVGNLISRTGPTATTNTKLAKSKGAAANILRTCSDSEVELNHKTRHHKRQDH